MGNTVPTSQAQQHDLRLFLQDLSHLVVDAPLAKGKMLKSFLCRSEEGRAVVKVYVQRGQPTTAGAAK